ncbi:hypothetical protein [Mesoplasma lactucae]|uniref:Uncharacterized protein n=1 Tax=Mesoplasma lactucae ATCC 49193 TaxID=81460 RepID=A0A291IS99_9MOLU|nr:hypothetical protein [Mesoplasma lactucae]ATG97571.1 hypothetical protein CP520_02285 [Mesoplasma lactucae ATCC 49193]ATZ19970.1 hypothetical protein MLACT_v1c01480 [Mesoplasma lactucae ATCC 49193]MCL8217079.1 hypothetical protein [Mesoplasma lactucae ATCC 49193]
MKKTKLIAKILSFLFITTSIGVGGYLVYEFSKSNNQKIDYESFGEENKNHYSQIKFDKRETQQMLNYENGNYSFNLTKFQYNFLYRLKSSYKELLDWEISLYVDFPINAKKVTVTIEDSGDNQLKWKYSIM